MSFLEELRNKKSLLRRTETVVTFSDGRRVLESSCSPYVQILDEGLGFVVDTKSDNVPAKILDFVYLGSQDCCDIETLLKYNIKRVLSVGVTPPCTFPAINYKFVYCLDLPETNLVDVLKNHCVPFIQNAVGIRSNVLVHCNAGVSRSSAVVIGYLMLTQSCTYLQAYDAVKRARSCIKPNSGFEKQLQNLEQART